ncbi:MAG: S41 family peptidase [Bacteroidales bacterium]|nr:S41 family peptidase [Bacteroidales bacterium]
MKKILLYIGAALLTFMAVQARNDFNSPLSPNNKLRMAEAAVVQLYVDSVDEEKLVEDAIKGMLEKLDPHSQYSNAEETKELNEPLEGNFSGIGISFNMPNDTLYVIQTISGGPSERVGMQAGDRIITVNDTLISGVKMKNRDIMKRLRGPKGTEVDLKVLRKNAGASDTINFKVTRADIPIYSVDAAYMVEPGIGYVRVNKFAAETPKEFREAVSKLKKQGMKDLILDLTDNGGGYLNAAVDMLGEMLPVGTMTVYTEGLNSPRHNNYAFPKGATPLLEDGRVAVMVNQYSASASEITAGAIQDWDRGLIVGRRTFGKGLVQRPVPFPDGSMMRLTIAHYYTPSGRDIQRPYTKGDNEAYAKDILDRFHSGELMHEDSIRRIDSLKVKTLRLNRDVYSGGGISPDRFVALDTTMYTKYYREVMAKGVFNRWAINYVDTHRKEMKKQWKTDDEFVTSFEITPEMLTQVYDMASSEGVEYNEEQAEISAPLFKMILKALIGRDTYENETYFKVYNRFDPIFRNALEAIKSDDPVYSASGK